MLTIGIDSGTQSTKAIVLDCDTGAILASGQQAYGLIEGLPPGHLEQHPKTWVDAVDATIRECLAKIGDRKDEVAGIGVSGQQHGCVVLDGRDQPIRPAKLWCDTSTAPQCEQFSAEFGGAKGLIDLVGNAILPGYTVPKLLWLKQNEPAHFSKIETVLLPHDYINFWLTGEKKMEFGDGSGTGWMDVRTRTWCQAILDFVDPSLIDHIPNPGSSRVANGLLRDDLRKAWGLKQSPVVSAGGFGRRSLPAISERRTDAQSPLRHRCLPRAHLAEHDPGEHGPRHHGRGHAGPRLWPQPFPRSRGRASGNPPHRRRKPERCLAADLRGYLRRADRVPDLL